MISVILLFFLKKFQMNSWREKCDCISIKERKKIIIVGNGGGATITSYVAVDLTKNEKTRCINFNVSDLITCFAIDYGYENWIEKAVEFYGDECNVLVAISSRGSSKNILKGCQKARIKLFNNHNAFGNEFSKSPKKTR